MSTALVERKLQKFAAFNRRYNDDGNGGPWTLAGRDYVLEEIWKPVSGYRVVPPTGLKGVELCHDCRRGVGSIVLDEKRTLPVDHAPGCPGPAHKPVIVTAVNVPRRSGKTHSILSYAMASLFLERNKRFAYICAAEDQAGELIETKIIKPLARHPELGDLYEPLGNKISVAGKNSWIEILPTSFGSITGRGYTHVFVDEARDIHARVAAALMGSIFDSHGVECLKGHGTWQVPSPGSGAPPAPAICPHCTSPLMRWYARLLFASSSGIINDNAEHDWFNDLVRLRLEKPHPSVYVFQTEAIINPSVSSEIVDVVGTAFADVPGLADYVAVEVHNKSIRRGEVYVRKQEVEDILDYSLLDDSKSTKPAVGFLDTSKTRDLASLIMLVDDAHEGEPTFTRLALWHMKIWDPANREDCPTGAVDPIAVEKYLDFVIPRFTSLLRLDVDVRVMPWAKQLVANCDSKHRGRVLPYEGNQAKDSAMYLELLDAIVTKRIRIPDDPRLKAELVALRKIDLPAGGIKVVDAGAGKDGRNRKKGGIHRDVAMSVAGACLAAAELKLETPATFESVKAVDDRAKKQMPRSPLADLGGLERGRW